MLVDKKDRYKFYSNGVDKVVAISTYEGKVVRGVAKCDPKDKFDVEAGKKLARARCAAKIAKKRAARAKREYAKALAAYNAAAARLDKMNDYSIDSKKAAIEAAEYLTKLEKDM
jgi:hypothetical protein